MQEIAIIGGGTSGMLSALLLAKRGHNINLFAPPALSHSVELPYICSNEVISLLREELPEVWALLNARAARSISLTDMVSAQFNKSHILLSDNKLSFLCCSSSLLLDSIRARIECTLNINLINSRVSGLVYDGIKITGIVAEETIVPADFVIDASGIGSQRSAWLQECGLPVDTITSIGPRYCSISKIYEYSGDVAPSFQLCIRESFRGGIYPLEGKRFALALILREDALGNSETAALYFFNQAILEIPNAGSLLSQSKETSSLQVLRGIQNRKSNFYKLWLHNKSLRNFCPIGDTILFGNPIYGRGISLSVMQIKQILKLFDGKSLGTKNVRIDSCASSYWLPGALNDQGDNHPKNAKERLVKLVRAFYQNAIWPQLNENPVLYRNFLLHHQLLLPAWKIARPQELIKGIARLVKNCF